MHSLASHYTVKRGRYIVVHHTVAHCAHACYKVLNVSVPGNGYFQYCGQCSVIIKGATFSSFIQFKAFFYYGLVNCFNTVYIYFFNLAVVGEHAIYFVFNIGCLGVYGHT